MLMVLYSTGMRNAEMRGLQVTDIDSRSMPIHIQRGKGGRNRYVPLSATLLETLRVYWRWMKPKTWLFPGTIAGWRADKPITPKVVWDACQYAATCAQIEKRVSAHGLVWTAQVAKKALADRPSGRFDPHWSADFLRDVARISVFKDGPSLVREFLEQHGIVMVVEPALSAWLDGAAMMCRDVPVIAVTLRHDRLDNFWFVVMHELVHLFKHLGTEAMSFYDDLDSDDQADPKEVEADKLAGEILIPSDEWRTSPASRLRSADAANHLAQHLRIHPAIVAGKIRKTYKDYRVLSGLVGQGEVRKHFPEFQE